MASSYDLYRQAEELNRQGEAYKKQADELKVAIAEFSASVDAALTKIGTACEKATSVKKICLESPDTNIQKCANEDGGLATDTLKNLNDGKSNLDSEAKAAISAAQTDADEYTRKADELFGQSEAKRMAARQAAIQEAAARREEANNSA